MIVNKYIFTLLLFFHYSCEKSQVKFVLISNEKHVIEIPEEDIAYYDTGQVRGYIEIHEIRLKDNLYTDSLLVLEAPLIFICEINDKVYFRAEHFCLSQSEPSLAVNFHFDPDCENKWSFNESEGCGAYRGDTIYIKTLNGCNSIELFHRKNRMTQRREYYEKQAYFQEYIQKSRLAHEILLDPYYLNALKASGIEIR